MKVIVRQGDTVDYYRRLFGLPLSLILDSNPFYPDQQLDAGVSVNIPGFIKISYTLKDGETFWSVLTERGIDLDQVLLLNPNKFPDLGYARQSLDRNPFPLINLPWPSIPAR